MILDTNALSALAEGDDALEPVLRGAAGISIPAIVLGEYKFGIGQSRNRNVYEAWLAALIANCRLLTVDGGTADCYADIRAELKRSGHPIPGNDLWIAALVRQHELPLVSLDKHFDHVARLTRISW